VGDEEQYYTLEDKNMVPFLNESPYWSLLPPEGTTHVMVNCMEDNIAANRIVGNLTDAADAADSFFHAMVILGWASLLACISGLGSCIYCCVFGCDGKSGTRRAQYDQVEM
jgi:hypothetical protein